VVKVKKKKILIKYFILNIFFLYSLILIYIFFFIILLIPFIIQWSIIIKIIVIIVDKKGNNLSEISPEILEDIAKLIVQRDYVKEVYCQGLDKFDDCTAFLVFIPAVNTASKQNNL